MDEPAPSATVFRFGVFEVDLRAGQLRRHGLTVRLQEKPLQILGLLLENPGQVVTREELQQKLWLGDTFVDFEHSLNNAVNRLRGALGDTAQWPRYIETLPRHGYRFIAPVEAVAPAPKPPAFGSNRLPRRAAASRIRVRHVWAFAVALVAVLLAASYLGRRRFGPREPPGGGRIMLVVLPFENLSGDPEQEYVSDGLTEEMITRLGGLNPKRLGVIARTSAMTYKGNQKPVDQIGHELGVDYVVEGSVRRVDEQVRVSVQLIQASDQTHLWAHNYDRALHDILSLQGEVARAVAQEVNVQLQPKAERGLAGALSVNPDAYHSYLKGRYDWNKRSRTGLLEAVDHFEQAIEQDPHYAAAYAGLADTYHHLGFYGFLQLKESYPKAKAAALKALEIDESRAEAHASLGNIYLFYEHDWEAAERSLRRALELDANYAPSHQWYSMYLAAAGRLDESVAEIELAQQLDPLSLIVNTATGYMYYFARDYDQTIEQCRLALELNPNFMVAHAVLGWAYEQKGMHEEAIRAFQKALELSGVRQPVYLAALGHAYALVGRKQEARQILDELDAMRKQTYIGLSNRAVVHAALGEPDQAVQWLERAREEGDIMLVWLKVSPRFDSLRSDPRFQQLLRSMNFPE